MGKVLGGRADGPGAYRRLVSGARRSGEPFLIGWSAPRSAPVAWIHHGRRTNHLGRRHPRGHQAGAAAGERLRPDPGHEHPQRRGRPRVPRPAGRRHRHPRRGVRLRPVLRGAGRLRARRCRLQPGRPGGHDPGGQRRRALGRHAGPALCGGPGRPRDPQPQPPGPAPRRRGGAERHGHRARPAAARAVDQPGARLPRRVRQPGRDRRRVEGRGHHGRRLPGLRGQRARRCARASRSRSSSTSRRSPRSSTPPTTMPASTPSTPTPDRPQRCGRRRAAAT